MGYCCVKLSKPEEAELSNKGKTKDCVLKYKDNKDAIGKIIRIQAALRRYRAMKNYSSIRECSKKNRLSSNYQDLNLESDNLIVKEIEKKLGKFAGDFQHDSNKRKIEKHPIIFDNGSKYIGEL